MATGDYNTGVQEMRVGVLGLGFMGATHAAAITGIEGAQLRAVCSSNAERLRGDLRGVGGNTGIEFGQLDFSKTMPYLDWHELVADPGIDAVDICLPTPLHAPVAIAALQAGKHVLCEKPMALSVAECREMLAAAAEADRTLMVGQVLRFFPEYQWLQETVRSARYGRVLQATFIRRTGLPDWSTWLPREAESGGALLDLLIHDIDQAIWLFGVPLGVTAKSMGPVDTMMASLLYPNGPEVRIQGGWFPTGTAFSMSFRVRFERAEVELAGGELFLSDLAGQRASIGLEKVDPYRAELEYFFECCRDGLQPEYCLPEASAMAVQTAECLRASRANGGTQRACLG